MLVKCTTRCSRMSEGASAMREALRSSPRAPIGQTERARRSDVWSRAVEMTSVRALRRCVALILEVRAELGGEAAAHAADAVESLMWAIDAARGRRAWVELGGEGDP